MTHLMGNFTSSSILKWTPSQIDTLSAFLNADDDFYEYISNQLPVSSMDTDFDNEHGKKNVAPMFTFSDLTIPASLLRALGFASLDEHITNFHGERLLPLVEDKIREVLAQMWKDIVIASAGDLKLEEKEKGNIHRSRQGKSASGNYCSSSSGTSLDRDNVRPVVKREQKESSPTDRRLLEILEKEIAECYAREKELDEELEIFMGKIEAMSLKEEF